MNSANEMDAMRASGAALGAVSDARHGGAADEVAANTLLMWQLPSAISSLRVLTALALIVAVWWGRSFLIPVVSGLLLAMLLAPIVQRMARLLHSRVLSAALALLFVAALIGVAGVVFGGQLARVSERAPAMLSLAAKKVAAAPLSKDSLVTRSQRALQDLDRAASRIISPGGRARAASATAPPEPPLSVSATAALRHTAIIGSSALMDLAADLAVIFFVTFFVLSGGPILARRFLGLWANPNSTGFAAAAHILYECSHQIRVYAGVLMIANILIGLVVWLAFWAADLPDAGGWALTAAVLHVVPYLGTAVLVALTAGETFLVHGTWLATLSMVSVIVLATTLIGMIMATWLQGYAARMNPAVVFIGVIFWGALWGAWGFLLGPALVVVLKVIAEHLPGGKRIAHFMSA